MAFSSLLGLIWQKVKVVTRGNREEELQSWCLTGTVAILQDESILETNGGNGYATGEVKITFLSHDLKTGENNTTFLSKAPLSGILRPDASL
jgi:hypothetical protein